MYRFGGRLPNDLGASERLWNRMPVPQSPMMATLASLGSLYLQSAAGSYSGDEAAGVNWLLAPLSARITCITALVSARWEKAWGKFPRWRPLRGSISSA